MVDEVIILAAGVGQRMRPLTEDLPKCLAPFMGATLLDRLLDQLEASGVKKATIVGGHCHDRLRQHLQRRNGRSLRIQEARNPNYLTTNSVVSAAIGLESAVGQVILCNSDVIYEPAAIDMFVRSDAPFAFTIDRSSYSEESEKLVLGSDGRVVRISKTVPPHLAHGCSTDIYRLSREPAQRSFYEGLLTFLSRPGAERCLFEDYLDCALLFHRFEAVDVSACEWYEVDTLAELQDAEVVFKGLGAA